MSALGDISAALGPAAQGIGQGLAGGAQLQAQYAQQQQRINTDAAAQQAQARYQQQQIAELQEENDRRDYNQQLTLLSDPSTVALLTVKPEGQARIRQAHAAINQYAAKYGWAGIPSDTDTTDAKAVSQAASTAAVTNALQSSPPSSAAAPGGTAAAPGSGAGPLAGMSSDLSAPSLVNPWDRNHAATVLAVHEGLDKAHLVNVGRAMQAELEGHLGNPQAATWLGPTYDQALTLRNKLATMLNNPKTSAADLRALIGQHPIAAEEHSQAVGGRPFAQATSLQMPDLNVMLGRTSPGDSAPQSAMLPAGVAGPQPPPGSIRTAGGTQLPPQSAALPPGVAGPQPPAGAYRDATGTVMPPAAVSSSPSLQVAPSPSAAAAPTAPAPPPTAPAAPTVPGMPGTALGSMTPAGQALFSFNYQDEVARLEKLYPGLLPQQIQQLAQGTLGALQTQAVGQENSALFPLKIIAAYLEQGKTIAETKAKLAEIGYQASETAIAQTRNQIEQQNANTARMNAQTEKTKAEAEAGRFKVTTGLEGQRITNEKDNQELTAYQRAATITNQEERQKVMLLRADLPRLQADARQATDKFITSSNARGGLSIGTAGMGISGGGGVTVTKQDGYSYDPNQPATKAYMAAQAQVNALLSQPNTFVGRDLDEKRLLTNPPTMAEKTDVKALKIRTDKGQPNGFVDAVNGYAPMQPAKALRFINIYRTIWPGKPLPQGIDLSAIGGALPAATATPAASATAPANQPPPNPVHSLLDSILNPYPRGSQDVTKPNPSPSLGEFALGGMP